MANNKNGVDPGFVAGRILSLPFKAAFAIGKFIFTNVLNFAENTQNEYHNMSEKSPEDVVNIALGKKGTSEQQVAARMYVKNAINDSKK